MHTLLRHGVGSGAVKIPTFRSPSSRGLSCIQYIYKRGKPPTRAGNHPTAHLQNLSLPKYRVFSNPPPPITRQHAEGGSEHFSVSPLPTPAVSRDRQCCTRVGEKRKRKIDGESSRSQFDEKIRVGKHLQVIIIRLISTSKKNQPPKFDCFHCSSTVKTKPC